MIRLRVCVLAALLASIGTTGTGAQSADHPIESRARAPRRDGRRLGRRGDVLVPARRLTASCRRACRRSNRCSAVSSSRRRSKGR